MLVKNFNFGKPWNMNGKFGKESKYWKKNEIQVKNLQ